MDVNMEWTPRSSLSGLQLLIQGPDLISELKNLSSERRSVFSHNLIIYIRKNAAIIKLDEFLT